MAQFLDQTFEELVSRAPKLIREGLTGTQTFVVLLPESDRALIVELNVSGRPIGTWIIRRGNAYRITPGKVVRMPLIRNDQNLVRRFCRLNGIALTRIKYVARNEEVYFGPAHHQGDSNFRSIEKDEPPIALKWVDTVGNPAVVWKILVVRGEEPKTWSEFCQIAKEWPNFGSEPYKFS